MEDPAEPNGAACKHFGGVIFLAQLRGGGGGVRFFAVAGILEKGANEWRSALPLAEVRGGREDRNISGFDKGRREGMAFKLGKAGGIRSGTYLSIH